MYSTKAYVFFLFIRKFNFFSIFFLILLECCRQQRLSCTWKYFSALVCFSLSAYPEIPLMNRWAHSTLRIMCYRDNSWNFNQQKFIYKTKNLLQHKSQLHKGLHPFLTGVYSGITLNTVKKCESNAAISKGVVLFGF